MMKGMNSTMIYCKKFYKCHNVPPVENNKKEKGKKKKELGKNKIKISIH
jgi:hypothetical protein